MSFTSREFRDVLGAFTTGVCIITAHPDGGEPFGVTVNSFASVSLEPPLVLWSLQNDSEMYQAFEQSSQFGVNILRSQQQGLANQYAKKDDHNLSADHFEFGVSGVPIMPATMVSMECEVEARHPGGDHIILVGRVVEFTRREPGQPLLFCAGSYRDLAS